MNLINNYENLFPHQWNELCDLDEINIFELSQENSNCSIIENSEEWERIRNEENLIETSGKDEKKNRNT